MRQRFVEASRPPEGIGELHPRFDVRRVVFHGRREPIDGVLVAAGRFQDHADAVMRLGRFRCEADGGFELFEGAGGIAGQVQRRAEIHARVRILRRQLDRHAKVP